VGRWNVLPEGTLGDLGESAKESGSGTFGLKDLKAVEVVVGLPSDVRQTY